MTITTTRYQKNFHGTMPFSNNGVMMLLEASTALGWTVPGTSGQIYRAHFSVSTSADVWVCLNGTAAVPTSNTATATVNQERIDVEFNRYVKGGDSLSFISTGTPQVGVSLLQVQDIT
ncbi:hypothetical protein UFOVP265_8 [uncultured Caudovirales phage]|jgi:hypothetical protein|uniref:Uncharacterized protein n=1 Tax=uncultured Caudovirales phage TaxID=2100421 RepID=A0A6J5LIB0_9CAUD|nr:hypothetical protein UFOVP265_8 [uncultured Caudovirales phage]